MGWLVGWLVVGQWIIGMVLMNNNMLIEIIERGPEKAVSQQVDVSMSVQKKILKMRLTLVLTLTFVINSCQCLTRVDNKCDGKDEC